MSKHTPIPTSNTPIVSAGVWEYDAARGTESVSASQNAPGFVEIKRGNETTSAFHYYDVVAVTTQKDTGRTQINFKGWWLGTTVTVSDVMSGIAIAREKAIAAVTKVA
jgi:hypothetical protein